MEQLLGDGFVTSAPIILPFLILVAIMAAAQYIRICNAWLVERNLDARFAVVLISAHSLIIVGLWQFHLLGALFFYQVLLILTWLFSPVLESIREWFAIRGLSDRDIVRYRYRVHIDPSDAGSYVGLANAYLERGRRKDAIAAYEKAVALDPLHEGLASSKLRNLAEMHVRQNMKKHGLRAMSPNNTLDVEEEPGFTIVTGDDSPSIPEL